MAKQRWWKDKEGVDSVWLDKDDTEDFGVNFTPYLSTNAETVASYTVSTTNMTVASDTESSNKISFLASGVTGTYGEATFQITTSSTPAKKKSLRCRFYKREF